VKLIKDYIVGGGALSWAYVSREANQVDRDENTFYVIP